MRFAYALAGLLLIVYGVGALRLGTEHLGLLGRRLWGTLLDDLNEEQLAAVQSPVGNVRVCAGPGSGKTRVLVHRIAHLLQNEDIDPGEILAVTFTRKAAIEMKERVGNLVGKDVLKRLTVCTLHSFCCMALRIASNNRNDEEEGEGRGANSNLDSSFSIYDGDDSRKLIRSIMQSMTLREELLGPAQMQEYISLLKREGYSPAIPIETFPASSQLRPEVLDLAKEVLEQYTMLMRFSNARDFDDLICDTLALLRSSSSAAVRLKNRYNHVLVDEWQDVDKSQYALLTELVTADPRKVLTREGTLRNEKSLFVVGDPQQTIYSWRGADPLNIQKFEADYQGCTRYDLKKNYRSVQGIVNAASGVMASTKQQQQQQLLHQSPEDGSPPDDSVQVVNTFKDETQAEFVAQMASYMLHSREASRPVSLAVLYRRHSLSAPIESALIRHGLPYAILGGPGLLGRKNVKDLCAYLRLLVNPFDTEALRRTINNPPRGVGKACEDLFFTTYGASPSVNTPLLDMLIDLGESNLLEEEEKKKKKGEEGGAGQKKKKAKEMESTSGALTTRQKKALGGAGRVFASLRQLLTTWTGPLEELLLQVLTISGLKERAECVVAADDNEKKLNRQRGLKARKTVAGTKELDQLLLLAREYEKNLEAEVEAAPMAGEEDMTTPAVIAATYRVQLFLDMLQLHAEEEEEEEEEEKEAEEGSEGSEGSEGPEGVGGENRVAPPSHKGGKIKLMTLHAAKGLEFDCVMIVGLEETCLPATAGGFFGRADKRKDNDEDADKARLAEENFIDEERRLLYVGMTRARKKLLLLYRSRISLGGSGSRQIPVKPSRFLKSLEAVKDVAWVRAS